jgi:hypothetical protein
MLLPLLPPLLLLHAAAAACCCPPRLPGHFVWRARRPPPFAGCWVLPTHARTSLATRSCCSALAASTLWDGRRRPDMEEIAAVCLEIGSLRWAQVDAHSETRQSSHVLINIHTYNVIHSYYHRYCIITRT